MNSQLCCGPLLIPKLSEYLLMEVVLRNGAISSALVLSFIQGQCCFARDYFHINMYQRKKKDAKERPSTESAFPFTPYFSGNLKASY